MDQDDPSTLFHFSEPMTSKRVSDYFSYIIFFISFSVYLFTALPSTYWRDTPEFQTIGFLLDIAHPAGSPLYAIVAKLFSMIPIGSIAFKTTLVSAAFGAGICVLVYYIIKTVLEQVSENLNSSPNLLCGIALFSTLAFSFSNALWENANATEVYALQNFFTALFILILLKTKLIRPGRSRTDTEDLFRLFALLSFLFGLSLGAHAILILYLPLLFFFVYFIWLRPASLPVVKSYSLLFFFFLLGFSVYLYLPIRSTQNPHYDWGNPETFRNFLIHVSDRKDASYHFSLPEPLTTQFLLYFKLLISNFSILGLLVAGAGLFYLFVRREKKLLIFFSLFYFPPFIFFIRYWRWNSAFIPTFLVVTFLIAVGVWFITKKCREWQSQYHSAKNYAVILWGLLGIQLIFLFSDHLQQNYEGDYWATRSIYRTILNDVPPNSIIFMVNTIFGLTYMQQIEGLRPDVTLMRIVDFLTPQVFSEINQEKYPYIVIPTASKQEELGPLFIENNIRDHPIYWEPSLKYNNFVLTKLIPDGFLFQVSPTPVQIDSNIVESSITKFKDQINPNTGFFDPEENTFYWNAFAGRGMYFLETAYLKVALGYFQMALTLAPDDAWGLKMMGVTHAQLEELNEAERFFLKNISISGRDAEVYRNLGLIYESQGKIAEAEKRFLQALRLDPGDVPSQYYLGKIYQDKGEREKALSYFQKVIEKDPNYEDSKERVDQLLRET
ncbi:MAG: DUF2723 domain-containing protein [Candidatus Manganitrophus sp.]|nr:DUF2723 domain-containing protein [Candidatus Manganitrophus sp.]